MAFARPGGVVIFQDRHFWTELFDQTVNRGTIKIRVLHTRQVRPEQIVKFLKLRWAGIAGGHQVASEKNGGSNAKRFFN